MNDLPTSQLTKSQKIRKVRACADGSTVVCDIRWDDQCGNGHNSFAITGEYYEPGRSRKGEPDECGSIHDRIVETFPELAHVVKYHGMTSEGPLHYIANTTYLAGDRDCNGLREGETRQIKNGRTGEPVWSAVVFDAAGTQHEVKGLGWKDSAVQPADDGNISWAPVLRIGSGKEPDFEGARRCAVWPDATLEQLQDKEALLARLPALMVVFKIEIERLGFTY